MAAPSTQVSRQRFSAQQALLLLDKWTDDQDGDISTSSSSAGESESSDSEAEAVTVPVRTHRPHVREHSPTPTATALTTLYFCCIFVAKVCFFMICDLGGYA